jgi:tRNA U34 5-carboxymethylaminomethyl modifying GTPase MnmE/TrmE
MGPETFGPTGPDFVVNSISYKFTQVTSSKPLLQKRHIDLINKINLQSAELINNFEDIAILDQSARSLELSINELIGVIPNKSLLNSIFNNFCIGK